MKKLLIPTNVLLNSISEIQKIGNLNRECFCLWLGKRSEDAGVVKEIFIPEYDSGSDYYKITDKGSLELINYIMASKLTVLAQIHSHPQKAFHSLADDRMATVAHIGGLSFVVPYFGKDICMKNFEEHVKVFKLAAKGKWQEDVSKSWEVVND